MEGSTEGMKACSAVVFGQVQGVGYRYSALRAASKLHVNGWVRNNRDGSVEIECEGAEKDVDEFIVWLRKGPPYARVTAVNVSGKPYRGIYSGFSIEY